MNMVLSEDQKAITIPRCRFWCVGKNGSRSARSSNVKLQQQSRGRLTCFCRACCDVIWSRHDAKFHCMIWSCFVTQLLATGRSHMVVALLYEMQSPCNWFTLSLSGGDNRRSNSWWDDNDAMMEIKVSSRWQWRLWRCFGDGDERHKMVMAISCHIFWFHVIFMFYASYFA